MTIDEFLLARYNQIINTATSNLALSVEDRTVIWALAHQLKTVVRFHQSWPVLAHTKPVFKQEPGENFDPVFSLTQQMVWLTQEEYVKKFGEAPPTAPMLRKLAESFKEHPDYDPAWE